MVEHDAGVSTVTSLDGIARIVLVGDVDEFEADRLRQYAVAGLQQPLHQLVVELHDCSYLAPAAVDLLGELFGGAAEQGAAIAVRGAKPNVRVILGISGLLELADSGQDWQ
jgi:anti-anti-sigma factor